MKTTSEGATANEVDERPHPEAMDDEDTVTVTTRSIDHPAITVVVAAGAGPDDVAEVHRRITEVLPAER